MVWVRVRVTFAVLTFAVVTFAVVTSAVVYVCPPALREEQEGESRVLSGADYAVPDLWIRVSCLPSVSTG